MQFSKLKCISFKIPEMAFLCRLKLVHRCENSNGKQKDGNLRKITPLKPYRQNASRSRWCKVLQFVSTTKWNYRWPAYWYPSRGHTYQYWIFDNQDSCYLSDSTWCYNVFWKWREKICDVIYNTGSGFRVVFPAYTISGNTTVILDKSIRIFDQII